MKAATAQPTENVWITDSNFKISRLKYIYKPENQSYCEYHEVIMAKAGSFTITTIAKSGHKYSVIPLKCLIIDYALNIWNH